MNQCKLEVVKQEMARVNVNILGISELRCTGMGEFNSDNHYIYYCGQESLRRNGIAIIVNKRVRNAVLGCNLKKDRMISIHFQGKPFNITVIQAYAPTSNAEKQWRSSIQSSKTRPGADCGSDHELFIAKFRLKLKKVGKTTRPFRYGLNQIPYDDTVEVRNRFKGLDLIDKSAW